MTAEGWTPFLGPHGTGSSAGSAAAARGAQIRARPRACAAAPAAACSTTSGSRQGSALAESYELTQQPVLACGMGVMKRLFQGYGLYQPEMLLKSAISQHRSRC